MTARCEQGGSRGQTVPDSMLCHLGSYRRTLAKERMNDLILKAGSGIPLLLALLCLMIDICVLGAGRRGRERRGGEEEEERVGREGELKLITRSASGPKEGQ